MNIVNYRLNPSYEVNVTDDMTFWQAGAGATLTRSTAQYKVGVASAVIRAGNNTAAAWGTTGVSVPNGATVSGQAWIRCSADPAGNKAQLYVNSGGGFSAGVPATAAANGAWEHLTVSYTNNSGGARTFLLEVYNLFNDSAADVWFDACQLELASVASAYTDGAQGEGHSWAGTAHNSISTWTEPAMMGSPSISPYMMI